MKKLIFIFAAFSITILSEAQMGATIAWAKNMGGTGSDGGRSIIVDPAGNIYTTGYFEGTADFDPSLFVVYNMTSSGGIDIFITKQDPTGNLIWAKQISGLSNNDMVGDICFDPGGNILLTGNFGGTADFDPGVGVFNLTSTSTDVFILKLDVNGNFIFAKQMPSNGIVNPQSITTDVAGNILTIGYFDAMLDLDPGAGIVNLTSASYDSYISKLDASGNYLWAKQISGPFLEFGYSVETDNAGNIYLSGDFYNTVDFDPGPGILNLTSNGISDIFIEKLDANGQLVWAKQIGGVGGDACRGMELDASGNIYLTGGFHGLVDFDPNAGVFNLASNGAAYVCRLNANGQFGWAKSITGGALDDAMGFAVALDIDRNIYSTGSFSGTIDFDPDTSVSNLTSNGSVDIYISKLDSTGNFIFSKKMGDAGYDRGYSISLDVTGNILTTGIFEFDVNFDPGVGTASLSSNGGTDVFIQKLRPCAIINAQITSQTNISCDGAIDGSATITASGGTGLSYFWSSNAGNLPSANNLAPGSYTCTIFNSCGNIKVQPVIITEPAPLTSIIDPDDTTICAGSSVTLNAFTQGGTAPFGYQWSNTGTTASISVAPLMATNYSLTVTDVNGCTNTASSIISTIPNPNVNYNIVGSNVLCEGGAVTLSGTGAVSYSWNGGISNGVSFNPASSGSYTVTGTAANGCTAAAVATITVNPLPTVDFIATTNDTVCEGQSIILTGLGASSYIWSGGILNSVSFVPPLSFIYTVTGTDINGCTNSTSASVVVNPVPMIDLGADIVQPNGPVILDAGVGFTNYLWNTMETTQTISVSTGGQYIVDVSNAFYCWATDTIEVNFTSGIEVSGEEFLVVILYPNPTSDILYIEMKGEYSGDVRLEILNVMGEVLISKNMIGLIETINMEEFRNGIYLLNLYKENKKVTHKIIKN